MSSSGDRERALALLDTDPLRHIVGLKMLQRLGQRVTLRRAESALGWALLALFDSEHFEYDARHYPGRTIALLEGSSETLACALLEQLPAAELVLKTQLPGAQRHALDALGARPAAAFLSFTAPAGATFTAPPSVRSAAALTPELVALFAGNGYQAPELEGYFARGARWFALEHAGAVAAACFVFQNHGPVWEVAGVHTAPEHRRQGLASQVVRAALADLLAQGQLPRYQVALDNRPSVELAQRLGLQPFLRMEHLLLSRAPRRSSEGQSLSWTCGAAGRCP